MVTPTFGSFDAAGARHTRDVVALIHQDSYAQRIASGDAFAGEQEFMRRFDAYATRAGFQTIVAFLDGAPIGQAWGWPLSSGSAWWRGLVAEPEPGFTDEDGTRTFVLGEIMVRQEWTGLGVAHALHDRLLPDRHETRAALLVRPDNTRAQAAYERWGWQKVTQLQPRLPHAPLFDVHILDLPRRRSRMGDGREAAD